MSAEANIKEAYEKLGAKVVSIKRENSQFRVEIEVNGRKMKRIASDPSKGNWKEVKLFEQSLREIRRLAAT